MQITRQEKNSSNEAGERFNIINCYYQIVSVQNRLSKLYYIFCKVFFFLERAGAPNEDIVQNHLT